LRTTDRSGRGRSLLGVAAFGLVVALVGAVLWVRHDPPTDVVGRDSVAAATSSATPSPPAARIATWRPGAPRSIRIDRLGVRAPIQPIHTVGRERLFSQEAPGRLVLITCEDWDGTAYRSNVVVTAQPVE
jgi:hypothetical protein